MKGNKNMIKKICTAIAAVLLITILSAVSAAEEAAAVLSSVPDVYTGRWQCGPAELEIAHEQEGCRVLILWGNGNGAVTQWEYSCYYEEDEHTVVSMPVGTCTEFQYSEDGALTSMKTVYCDGIAVFSLDEEGCLIWLDEKENAGEGMRFTKIL